MRKVRRVVTTYLRPDLGDKEAMGSVGRLLSLQTKKRERSGGQVESSLNRAGGRKGGDRGPRGAIAIGGEARVGGAGWPMAMGGDG